MKIAIVANNLRAGGGYTVACNFIPALLGYLKTHTVMVVLPRPMPEWEKAFPEVSFISSAQGSTLARFFWQKTVMTRTLRSFAPDWTFFMGNYAIGRLPGKSVMLLHNLLLFSPVEFRGNSLKDWLLTHLKQIQLRRSFSSVARVYLQSPVVQSDFISYWKFPKEKTDILKLAMPEDVRATVVDRMPCRSDGIFRLAYVARVSPAKNHNLIVRTYARYKEALAGTHVTFTMDPRDSKLAASIARNICASGLESFFSLVGELARSAVFDLYRTTDALVMPTEKETLGYPYLEAMHFGCPIITSDMEFAHAICKDAAIYVDPRSPEALRDAILKVKEDSAFRLRLIQKGTALLAESTCDFSGMATDFLKKEGLY